MKVVIFSLFLVVTFFTLELHAESYQDCILKNMKNVNDRLAAVEIRESCLYKTTPQKCRRYIGEDGIFFIKGKSGKTELMSGEEVRAICIKECKEANLFSRKFGECSTD